MGYWYPKLQYLNWLLGTKTPVPEGATGIPNSGT